MNRLNSALAALFATTVLSTASQAATVNLFFNNGALFDTAGISGLNVTGFDMGNVAVTACFSVGGCETSSWAGSSGQEGGVTGNNWSLHLDGDSFSSTFLLTVSKLTSSLLSLSINGRPGLTAFDVTPPPDVGSPGSGTGQAFYLEIDPGAVVGTIDVVYSDKLSVGGTVHNDLYTVMTMNFSGGTGFTTGSMEFFADTDKTLNSSTPIVPVNGVPTPGTLALVGLALLGLAGQARRKAQP